MKILLIKMSSLGDIIHTFPALSDAASHIPNLQIDWVVEEAFAKMPKWHPSIRKVIPIALRRWRKNFKKSIQDGEIKAFLKNLKTEYYDYIIDAQGLLKSAIVAKLAHGHKKCGFDAYSARETLASLFYQYRYSIDPYQPVVQAIRTLFAKSLNYSLPQTEADFGLDVSRVEDIQTFPDLKHEKFLVFLHGTSHPNKEWPVDEWINLAKLAIEEGFKIYLPWGNDREHERAVQIAHADRSLSKQTVKVQKSFNDQIKVLPSLNINQLAKLLSCASGVVGLDTGFSHLAAALGVPTLAIFRASNPRRVSITGKYQQFIEALHANSCKNSNSLKRGIYEACQCFENIKSDQVFSKILDLSRSYMGIFKKK